MNISELFANVHKEYKVEDLKGVKENFEIIKDTILPEYKDIDIIEKKMKSMGLDINKLKFIDDGFRDILYIDGLFTIQLTGLLPLNNLSSSVVEKLKKDIEELEKKNDWITIFGLLPESLRMSLFNSNYKRMGEHAREVFEFIYTSNYYPLQVLDEEIMREVMVKGKCVKKLKRYIDKSGYITVYRGQTRKSTKLDKALSYSLRYEVAAKFASHFDGKDARVFKAKVKAKDVRMYYTGRGEAEVLVDYEDLIKIEDMKVFGNKEIMESLINEGYLYSRLVQLNEKYNFLDKEEIHGFNHSSRMLALTVLLYNYTDMIKRVEELRILGAACIAHDLGRDNDGEDESHGKESEKILNMRLVEDLKLEKEAEKILRFIIINHCLDDEQVRKNIKKSDIEDKVKLSRLAFLFKDIDNLDRVRLGDLDVSYLRNEDSKRMVPAAYILLGVIK